MRLKSLTQVAEPVVGDRMANGIMLRNSEVGMGSVEVMQLYWTLDCLNGMQSQRKSRHTHVTSARGTEDWSLTHKRSERRGQSRAAIKTARRGRRLH
jgi:hypothetical protein